MNWEKIKKEYESSTITLKALAEKHDIKLGTLKSRKSRDGWTRDATKTKKVATLKKDATEEFVPLPNNELTDKQNLFCMYYLKYFNATKAYQKAYGCAYTTARVEGSRHLTKPNIKAEIDRMKEEQARGIMLDAKSVLQKYIDIAFSDITDYAVFGKKEVEVMGPFGPIKNEETGEVMKKEVNYVDFIESHEIDGTLITEVKQGKDGISVKLADKMKALEKLADYLDLFPDNFKRKIEEEKLKIAQQKVKQEDEDETEDDGFLEALEVKVSEVWDDEEV